VLSILIREEGRRKKDGAFKLLGRHGRLKDLRSPQISRPPQKPAPQEGRRKKEEGRGSYEL
jgi:hypothetical protein